MSEHTPTEQRIQDTKATILAFFLRESGASSANITDIYVFAQALAKDLVRRQPSANAHDKLVGFVRGIADLGLVLRGRLPTEAQALLEELKI